MTTAIGGLIVLVLIFVMTLINLQTNRRTRKKMESRSYDGGHLNDNPKGGLDGTRS